MTDTGSVTSALPEVTPQDIIEAEKVDHVVQDCKCGAKVVIKRGGMSPRLWAIMLKIPSALCDDCEREVMRQEAEENAAEVRRQRFQSRLGKSLLPSRFNGLTWDDVDEDDQRAEAVDAAKRWGAGEIDGLVLSGPVGVGKTHLAAVAAYQRLSREAVRWYSVPRLIADSLSGWDSATRLAAHETLTGSMALVLDDIDKVKASEWVASQLFVAIDGRVQDGGAFLVTTNLDLDEFPGMFGAALSDRLFSSEVHYVSGQTRR